MLRDREKLYQAYRGLLSVALCWALILILNQYFELRIPVVFGAFCSLLPAVGVYFVHLYRKNTVTWLVIAGIFPVLALLFRIRKFHFFAWLSGLMSWIAVYNGSEELYQPQYARFLVLLVGLVFTAIFFLMTGSQALKLLLAAAAFAGMAALGILRFNMNKAAVGMLLFYILAILVEGCGFLYARKAGKQEKKESILYLTPVCLLLAILAVSLPAKAEPIKWTAVKKAYHTVKEQLEVWKTDLDYYFSGRDNEFFINFTGYNQDSGELDNQGIRLRRDDKAALKVSGDSRDRAVYLTGSVSDLYTGHSWEKSGKGYLPGEEDYRLDYMELVCALARQEPETLRDNSFVKGVSRKITYHGIRTRTFFYPLKTSSYQILSGKSEPEAQAASLLFRKGMGKGTSYQILFYEMNLSGDAFIQMLREADNFTYDRARPVNPESMAWLKENIFQDDRIKSVENRRDIYELLGDRAELIKKSDTGLPEALPSRVKELAQKITAGYSTDYDRLKAIEAYLRSYTYTLSPVKVPEGQDFVDYFLFESKEGYCTSYATAMAVLGRCVGIPTRYVEGYVAKYRDMDRNKDEDGMYPVPNSQAHAWAEAYIEGVGWIPLEATGTFYDARYTRWAEPGKTEQPAESYADLPEQYGNDYSAELTGSPSPPPEPEKKSHKADIGYGVLACAAAVLIILILLAIYDQVLKFRYRRVYNRSDFGKRMYLRFLRILELLKKEGYFLMEQETVLMLSRRIQEHPFDGSGDFPKVAGLFMDYRYGEKEITGPELDLVARFENGLAQKQRGRQSRVRLWLEEFIFLMKSRDA